MIKLRRTALKTQLGARYAVQHGKQYAVLPVVPFQSIELSNQSPGNPKIMQSFNDVQVLRVWGSRLGLSLCVSMWIVM